MAELPSTGDFDAAEAWLQIMELTDRPDLIAPLAEFRMCARWQERWEIENPDWPKAPEAPGTRA